MPTRLVQLSNNLVDGPFLQTMAHPIPMPIVRPVLICKAMGICLIFCKQKVPIALQIKTSLAIGIGDWVFHRLLMFRPFWWVGCGGLESSTDKGPILDGAF